MKTFSALLPHVLLTAATLANPALAADRSAAGWPQSDASHRAFFCGAANAAETMPRGYADALVRQIRLRTAQQGGAAEAIKALQANADCEGLIARTRPAQPLSASASK